MVVVVVVVITQSEQSVDVNATARTLVEQHAHCTTLGVVCQAAVSSQCSSVSPHCHHH